MAELTGSRIGPYEVIASIGAGGMGQVYRAHDSRLHRDVALKLLPPAFAADPDRLARFRREAQVLAALNHPNIAAIYGLEETTADGGAPQLALAMDSCPDGRSTSSSPRRCRSMTPCGWRVRLRSPSGAPPPQRTHARLVVNFLEEVRRSAGAR